MNENHSSENFALLVEIKTKLERVIQDVAKISNTVVLDVAKLQNTKQDKEEALALHIAQDKTNDDHETRLRGVEESKWKIIGIAVAFSSLLTIAGVVAAFLAIK